MTFLRPNNSLFNFLSSEMLFKRGDGFSFYCILNVLVYLTDSLETNEYCQFENFNPKCSSGEVIHIRKALFGRMKEGRCITQEEIKGVGSLAHDPKYFGCSVSVVNTLSFKCSFKQECNIKVSDESLKKTIPCLPGLNLHLEADYTCLPVYQTESSNCHLTVSERERHLLSESFKERRCGIASHPWIFEASKGQKVSVTLFGQLNRPGSGSSNQCDDVGVILQDGLTRKNGTLCRGDWHVEEESLSARTENNFKSSGNLLKMFAINADVVSNMFLFKVKADGCLDIIPPEDTWLKRNNDDIVIGCYSSKQTWYLRCEHGHWVGSVGNCSNAKDVSGAKTSSEFTKIDQRTTMPKNQQILAIVAICGMGVVICSMIICIGAVCARKYSLSGKAGQLKLLSHPYDSAYNQPTYQSKTCKLQNGQLTTNPNYFASVVGMNQSDQTYFDLEESKDETVNENTLNK